MTDAKILFLDFDGVLVTSRSQLAGGGADMLDRTACDLIAEVCRRAPCQLVISSTWREGRDRDHLEDILRYHGFERDMLHADWCTPVMDAPRQAEIDGWLAAHSEVVDWAILDDGIGLDGKDVRWVRTDIDDGLRFVHVVVLSALLGFDPRPWFASAGVRYTPAEDAARSAILGRLNPGPQ